MDKDYLKQLPLVSIGMPAYNRAQELDDALLSICNQTYSNIEVVVSDNFSSDIRVRDVLEKWVKNDSRVRSVRQDKNIGALANFAFVAEASQGEFFMWAADDDLREPWFIEKCLEVFSKNNSVAAVTAEVLYRSNGINFPFFPQGAAFYDYKERSQFENVGYVIENNVDNLVYSLFRRDAIFSNGKDFWSQLDPESQNELPAMLLAAKMGGFIVIPEPGFIKFVSEETYRYIRWEYCGGVIPKHVKVKGYLEARNYFGYHYLSWKDISRGINALGFSILKSTRLKLITLEILSKHYIQMLVGFKKARKYIPSDFHD